MAPPFPSLAMLDPIHRLPELDRFEPRALIEALSRDAEATPVATLEQLAALFDGLRDLFDVVDRFTQKSMSIRMQLLSAEPLPKQMVTLITSTIAGYATDLPLLRRRILPALERNDPGSADAIMTKIEAAATRVLAERETLRAGIAALIGRLAVRHVDTAKASDADRTRPDPERAAWRRARVELEQLVARPQGVLSGTFAERAAKLDTPPDELPREHTGDRFALLEID